VVCLYANVRKFGGNMPENGVPKTGFGGRQVGAFSIFRPGHTGIPFIFWRFFAFFRKIGRLRGWCNTTPVRQPKKNIPYARVLFVLAGAEVYLILFICMLLGWVVYLLSALCVVAVLIYTHY